MESLGIDPSQGLLLGGTKDVPLDPSVPALLGPLTPDALPSLRERLLARYPAGHGVSLVRVPARGKPRVQPLPLADLDGRAAEGRPVFLFLPASPTENKAPDFSTLVGIMARLRGPGGCPWDREQSHQSLKKYLLEECYETLEALDAGDARKLAEELGDLLLQIVFHAQIAREGGAFTIDDVVRGIAAKLVRRHPHVFGDAQVSSAQEVYARWDGLKRQERGDGASILDGVPKSMPALAYSQEVQARAARTGFDWKDVPGVLAKVEEEIQEFRAARDKAEQERELGDILSALVNVGRWLEIDTEGALRGASRRFYQRFTTMERLCRERGVEFDKLPMERKEALWQEVKRLLGSSS
ncbi:MAG: nucleoside triphosphate pyrophosphohydrolase [Chloroflexi bacterium]|nr:nucleoside triphosphate pyrophosphohydrolase [Chloroflexota bacterium]